MCTHRLNTPINKYDINITSEIFPLATSSPTSSPTVKYSSDFYHHKLVVFLLELYINVITQFALFSVCPLSENIILLTFIHTGACNSNSLFVTAE